MNQSDLTGRIFGKYKLYHRLGMGGMARVYKAYQSNLDRFVALKVLHAYLAEEDGFIGRSLPQSLKNGAQTQHHK